MGNDFGRRSEHGAQATSWRRAPATRSLILRRRLPRDRRARHLCRLRAFKLDAGLLRPQLRLSQLDLEQSQIVLRRSWRKPLLVKLLVPLKPRLALFEKNPLLLD